MPKLKTKKTLLKRVRVTKNKKLIRGQVNAGHLKVKWGAKKKRRKAMKKVVKSAKQAKKFRKMLGKHAKS